MPRGDQKKVGLRIGERLVDVAGAVLAGGQSRRMGKDKSKLLIGGRTLLERNLFLMAETFCEVLQVGGELPRGWEGKVARINDQVPGKGPLGGLHSALLHSTKPWVFLFACDMPFFDQRLVWTMAKAREGADVVVPKVRGQYEPLCALYSKGCLSLIERHLAQGKLALHALFPHLNPREIDETEMDQKIDRFLNLNTPTELDEFLVMNPWNQ